MRSFSLPNAFAAAAEDGASASHGASAGGFFDGLLRTSSGADEPGAPQEPNLALTAAACVPGRADALQLAAVEADGDERTLRLARLALADGRLGMALAALPAGELRAPISLHALNADTGLLLGAGGVARLVTWPADRPSDAAEAPPPPSLSLLPIRRQSSADGQPPPAPSSLGTLASLLDGGASPAGAVGFSGGASALGATLELAPLTRGETAFAFAHERARTSPLPSTSGFSPAPLVEAEDASDEAGTDAADAGASSSPAKEPPTRAPTHPPTLVHGLPPAEAGEPPTLQLVDLADGTMRELLLLPAPTDDDGGGGKDDPRAMEAALVAPVPSSAGGGAVTLHRNGELVRWQTAPASLASGLADWRAIVGYGGEGGGREGAQAPLSIVRDFPSPKEATMPKHGKVDKDGNPHVGGNTWAGGTGGRDTAGLGGKGGPYRLSDGNPIHQISDAEKANVSPEALEAARAMAEEAWRERLQQIDMSEHDAKMYDGLLSAVSREVAQTRVVLQSREARAAERVWLRGQSHGDLDEGRLVDGMAGERAVYRRRSEQAPEDGAPQLKPKLLRFVMDLSGSMYYFNGYDGRLQRCLESAVMVMEALHGFEHKYKYSMVGHSGDGPCAPLIEYGAPPANEKERLRVVQRMAAHTQFCMSGDHTLEAAREAVDEVATHLDEADEAFVFLLSDANLQRYGIRPTHLRAALASNPKVHAHAIFLSSLGGEAERLRAALPPGAASVCLEASELPRAIRSAFTAGVLREES